MICPQCNRRGKVSDFVVGLGPGGHVPVHREMRCPLCSGRGEIDPDRDHTQAQYDTCPECNGTGKIIEIVQGMVPAYTEILCPVCDGTGEVEI